jgi:hypothetical protein
MKMCNRASASFIRCFYILKFSDSGHARFWTAKRAVPDKLRWGMSALPNEAEAPCISSCLFLPTFLAMTMPSSNYELDLLNFSRKTDRSWPTCSGGHMARITMYGLVTCVIGLRCVLRAPCGSPLTRKADCESFNR